MRMRISDKHGVTSSTRLSRMILMIPNLHCFSKFLTEAPQNIQNPVWTCWQTMILMTDVFLKNYVSIYFLAIAVKTHYKSDSYLWKLGCTLLSLMNERAEPSVDITDNIHHYIELFTTNNANERGCDKRNNAISLETSPTFYTMLLFFQAFCKYAFNHHFAFMKCNDPYFGSGTFGQLTCFMPERIYLMKREVSTL
jgi:hypothetical protein